MVGRELRQIKTTQGEKIIKKELKDQEGVHLIIYIIK